MTDNLLHLRPAIPQDCAQLTEIALASKAFWGYSDAFIRDCKPVLTVTPEMITGKKHAVLLESGEISGFHFLSIEEEKAELDLLYIAPHAIGRGYGAILFDNARETALAHGCSEMRIEADPNAVGFYKRMGAKHTGWARSEVDDDRELPLLMLLLKAQGQA